MTRRTGSMGSRTGRLRSLMIAVGCATAVFLSASTTQADEYEPSNAGNPLRIAAYALHPVGVIYDYLLLRPAFWVGSHEPFRTLFGRTD
jgi:hypothetical protein